MIRFATDHSVFGEGSVFPYRIEFNPTLASHWTRLSENELFIRVVAEPAISSVMLVTRTEEVTGYPLGLARESGDQNVWEATLELATETFDFSLACQNQAGEGVYITPAGVSNAVERIDRWHHEPLEIFSTPGWAQGALIYQIFPDRFANADPALNPVNTDPWGSDPHHLNYQGGDLAGIAERVPYLAGLGVDLIYLNPIFEAPSNHRYDVIDYYQVDRALGGNAALGHLIEELHRHDMKIMLDASFNHVHPRFFAFADLLENGPDSEYVDWFVINEWPLRFGYRPHAADGKKAKERLDWWAEHYQDSTGIPMEYLQDEGSPWQATYDSWYGLPHMPRVNLADPGARQYMLDVGSFWVNEFGVDGWRMDVARYVDPDFWNDFRITMKRGNHDVLLLSEIMGDAGDWLNGRRFDGTMDYTFRQLCLDFFAHGIIDAGRFWEGIVRLHSMYPPQVSAVNQHLLDSHDTARFRSEAKGEAERLLLAMAFQLTSPGAAGVFYGGELGLEGENDPGSRVAMPWGDSVFDEEPATTIKALLELRATNADLRKGEFVMGGTTQDGIWYRRGQFGVAINRSDEIETFPLVGRPVWGEGEPTTTGTQVAPMSATIIELT